MSTEHSKNQNNPGRTASSAESTTLDMQGQYVQLAMKRGILRHTCTNWELESLEILLPKECYHAGLEQDAHMWDHRFIGAMNKLSAETIGQAQEVQFELHKAFAGIGEWDNETAIDRIMDIHERFAGDPARTTGAYDNHPRDFFTVEDFADLLPKLEQPVQPSSSPPSDDEPSTTASAGPSINIRRARQRVRAARDTLKTAELELQAAEHEVKAAKHRLSTAVKDLEHLKEASDMEE